MKKFILLYLLSVYPLWSGAETVSNYEKALIFQGAYVLESSTKTSTGENLCNDEISIDVLDIGIQTQNVLTEVYRLLNNWDNQSPLFKFDDDDCTTSEYTLTQVEICHSFNEKKVKFVKRKSMKGYISSYLYEVDIMQWRGNDHSTLVISYEEGLNPWSRGSDVDYQCIYKRKN